MRSPHNPHSTRPCSSAGPSRTGLWDPTTIRGVHYSQEHGRTVSVYICQENTVRRGGRVCQSVPGKIVDPAIGALLVELMTPMAVLRSGNRRNLKPARLPYLGRETLQPEEDC